MKFFLAAMAALLLGGAAYAADTPPITVTPVTRTSRTITGQQIVVPLRPDVIVATAVFAPGARLPEHEHIYPHYVYVLEGELTVVVTYPAKRVTVKAGEFVAEPMRTWHYGINNGTVPLKLLVIDQVPAGVKSNMVLRTP
ncbi:MAG TPA: cupin domain-containing protein [Rhizomicrobium sp.]|jgi:quercetin dioxygenase-like cupin family protein|nr:cupin domain-containing protein [Rhizomicrobium sp.]